MFAMTAISSVSSTVVSSMMVNAQDIEVIVAPEPIGPEPMGKVREQIPELKSTPAVQNRLIVQFLAFNATPFLSSDP